jgi:uncharacterized protein (TIGR02678 family)
VTAPESIQAALDRIERDERQRAARALLREPLLQPTGNEPDPFALVRKHAEWLRKWFSRNTGWSLVVEPELARLRKSPSEPFDGSRGACDVRTGHPFSRRRYVLLCLALAALERADRQTTLGLLVNEMLGLMRADPALAEAGMSFDLETHDQRRDLVDVVRWLLGMRVMVRIHGDEQQFLSGRGDALYNVNRQVSASLLAVRRGPSTIAAGPLDERLKALTEEVHPDTDDGRNRRIRWSLMRRLIDDPVTYYDELSAEEHAYLQAQRPFLLKQIAEATGLEAEIRAEGIALVDERDELTDLRMPEEGTDGHLALLLAEFLAEHLRRAPGVAVALSTITAHTATLIVQHRTHWRRDAGEPGAAAMLTRQAIERLSSLKLVQLRQGEQVLPRPAIGRFGVAAPRNEGEP